MTKKKTVHKTNAIRMLDQKKISYHIYTIPWINDHVQTADVAKQLSVEEERIFKTLVTVGNKTGPIVAVIPADQALDLRKLAQASGNKKMEMLPMKQLEEVTGYIRGGCSPIGMKKNYPMFLSDKASQFDSIIVSAGKRGMQIALAPKDLLKLTNGQQESLTN